MIIKKFALFEYNRGETKTFYHQSPKSVDRPTGRFHYFGTRNFMEQNPDEFGGKITEYELPENIFEITPDTKDGRDLAVKLADAAFPDDQNFKDELSAGDPAAFSDLYELWADSQNVEKIMTPDMDAIKFGEEYVVPQRVISKLKKIGIYKP